MATGLASFTRRAVLCADAFHLNRRSMSNYGERIIGNGQGTLSLRQTVQALRGKVSAEERNLGRKISHLDPLVCLIFWVLEPAAASVSPSSLYSPSCSNLVFFLAASLSLAGRFPEALATLPPLDGSGLSREESDSGVGWDAGGGGGGNKPDCVPDSPAC